LAKAHQHILPELSGHFRLNTSSSYAYNTQHSLPSFQHVANMSERADQSAEKAAEKQSTSNKRNRCRLDEIGHTRGYDVQTTPKYDGDTALDIVKGYWILPNEMPESFPSDYPPKPPLLDGPLEATAAADLRRAFTLNSVTYAIPGEKGNLVMEMIGDKYMGFMAASMVQLDIDREGEDSVFGSLDLGGLDVSKTPPKSHTVQRQLY
jgi:hypothetical protein